MNLNASWITTPKDYGDVCPVFFKNFAGFKKVKISPKPDNRLDWLKASLETRYGTVRSGWYKQENLWRFEIETPVESIIEIDGNQRAVSAGKYTFFTQI